jgi:hypothetical protein
MLWVNTEADASIALSMEDITAAATAPRPAQNEILSYYQNWYFGYTYQIIHNLCLYSYCEAKTAKRKRE